jgi:hypothetical protein
MNLCSEIRIESFVLLGHGVSNRTFVETRWGFYNVQKNMPLPVFRTDNNQSPYPHLQTLLCETEPT